MTHEERLEAAAKALPINITHPQWRQQAVRAVIEAYQIESEFGRTIEAYKDSLEIDGQSRQVDFLRVGRVALVYQSVGGQYYGVWDQKKRGYVELDATEYGNEIAKGLKIARKQVAPNLMMMPIGVPEAVQ